VLIDAESGQEVLREMLTSEYTATVGQAFYGVERLKIANEGVARENIRLLLSRIASLKD
jgi:hypothetical protein